MESLTVAKKAQDRLAVEREKIAADIQLFEAENAAVLGQHSVLKHLLEAVERAQRNIEPLVSDLAFDAEQIARRRATTPQR